METAHPLGTLTMKRLAGLGAAVLLAHSSAWATGDFYEEPAQTLADYLRLDQLPAKSFAQILGDTTARDAAEINYGRELLALPQKSGADAIAAIDKMIAAARAHGEAPMLNLLNDLRDLYAGPAAAAESAAYLEWRMEQADRFGISFAKPKPGEPPPAPKGPGRELIADIERHLAKASPALKPHWLYLRGAVAWLGHDVPASDEWFWKVVRDFPKSPRAEVAHFMMLRCAMWRTRSQDYTQQDMKLVPDARPAARKLFDEYFAKYPHGQMLGDAYGWYAAYAYDGHDFATALRFYMKQLELTDHPELQPAAAEMVEKTLSRLSAEPKDTALAEVAKHPQAAQALVYLIVNTSETDNYNGKYETIEQVRGWRKKLLPRLAAAIAGEGKRYENAGWKPRSLAMLAYAASGAGEHAQALKLLETAGAAMERSDDLLMARGVVLHRLKTPAEAAVPLQKLLTHFPKSPLAKGARLRLGLALTDDHRAGEAVLALQPLLPPPAANEKKAAEPDASEYEPDMESGEYPILYGIDVNQVRALIDALLNFAPIAELAAAARDPKLDPALRLQFHESIAQRLLAKEQFDEAKKYMTPAQFGLVAGPIEKLTKEAQDAREPAAHAAACIKLGDAWAATRGKLLTFPLDADQKRREVFIDFSAEADVRRAEAAPFVGAVGNFKADLEARDELRHAFNWWIEASDAQAGTPQTAQALWRALRAMPLIADVSPFTYERAVERKWDATARKLYDRLRKECVSSIEARRYAVAWDFPGPKKKTGHDDEGEVRTTRGADGDGVDRPNAFGIDVYGDTKPAEAAKSPEGAVLSLEEAAGDADVAKLQARCEAMRGKVRAYFSTLQESKWVNLIDDLALFFSEPDPGVEVRKKYAALRFAFFKKSAIATGAYDEDSATGKRTADEILQDEIKTALAAAETKPVADYYEFLNLAVVANHFIFVTLKSKDKNGDADTYRTRDYPLLAKMTKAFLAKYPKSKKREAALLLHARAVYEASKDVVMRKPVSWPQGARWEGGIEISVSRQEPLEPNRVAAALDEYDREFPHGRYAAEIRDFRAGLALRTRDWKTALALTAAQIDDKGAPALRGAAANRLGDLFDQLADERYRADILAAIKADRRGRELLTQYLAADSDTHPLRYMKAWLREQLGRN
jgi:outer membrane protein assembly factor BamD (BamD/ComL family)